MIPWARLGKCRPEAYDDELGERLWRWLEAEVQARKDYRIRTEVIWATVCGLPLRACLDSEATWSDLTVHRLYVCPV